MHVARNGIKRAAGRAARPLEQIFVYERGQLVFAESNNEVYNLHESRGQMTLRTLGYGKGHQKQTWEITPYGLALQAPCVLVRSSDARYNSLSDDALFPYRARTETDFLRSRADLAENGLLNGMDSAFPSLGYLGGCVERLDFHGHPAISMGLQTDVFADQAGGQVAYNWDKGLTPWIDKAAQQRQAEALAIFRRLGARKDLERVERELEALRPQPLG